MTESHAFPVSPCVFWTGFNPVLSCVFIICLKGCDTLYSNGRCLFEMRFLKKKKFAQMGLIHIFVLLRELLKCISPFYVAMFIYCYSFGRRFKHTHFLPVPTICFSLSSASPAHSPKEEYVITQSTDTAKEETVHDQSEDQGELRDDKSELTEKKSVTGWLAAHQLFSSNARCREYKHTKKSLPAPPPPPPPCIHTHTCLSLPFRGGFSLWIVSLPWAWWAGGGEVLGGAAGRPPGAAGERDAGGQEDGVPPTGKFLMTAHMKNKPHCRYEHIDRRR